MRKYSVYFRAPHFQLVPPHFICSGDGTVKDKFYTFLQFHLNLSRIESNFKEMGSEQPGVNVAETMHIAASHLSSQSFCLLDEFYGTLATFININCGYKSLLLQCKF